MPNPAVETALHIFTPDTNLSTTERAVSVVAGLALAAVGAKPRPNKFLSLAAILAGSALAIRGATGHCSIKAMISPEERDA